MITATGQHVMLQLLYGPMFFMGKIVLLVCRGNASRCLMLSAECVRLSVRTYVHRVGGPCDIDQLFSTKMYAKQKEMK